MDMPNCQTEATAADRGLQEMALGLLPLEYTVRERQMAKKLTIWLKT